MFETRRRLTSLVSTLALGCACLAYPATAVAQTSAGNKAAAEALFSEGRSLMQAENYSEACKKLEASQALDVGLGTLMLLSDCYEKLGKTASAWASFKDAAAAARAAGDQDRETVARARADALEPKLAKALVQASKQTLALGGLEVKMNGQLIPIAQLGTLVPIDPGDLTVAVSAAGYKPWEITVKVVDGPSETSIDIPDLEPEQKAAPPASTEPEPVRERVGTDSTMPAATPEDRAPGEPASTLKTVGIVLGAAGAVGIGVGSYFGLKASARNSDSKKYCDESDVCRPRGVELRDDAKSAATVSTITFGLGTALLATGVVLYLISPNETASGEAVSLRVGPAPGGARFSLGGMW